MSGRVTLHRRSLRTGLAGGALLSLGWVVAAPALGTAAGAAAPSAQCSTKQLAATANPAGETIAGFTVSGSAAAYRYEIDSPGTLPVGDAQKGNITELDVPYARENVSSGPLVASLASAAYPGDTAAGIGSALAEFGASGFPNDPVLASAAYPPSPNSPASSSYPPGGESAAANAGAASANADQNGGASSSSVSSYELGSGPSSTATGGPASAQSKIRLGAGCLDASSQSTTGGVTLAGIIHIADVSGTAQAMSDGSKAVPSAALQVGQVTVAGMAAYIDHDGIHLAGQQPVGYGVMQQVQAALNAALKGAGMTVKLIDPESSVQKGQAVASSGGVDVVIQQNTPAVGVPGVPAITVPGQPPIPLGTPGTPIRYEVTLGEADAAANATGAPGSGSLASPAAGASTSSSSASGSPSSEPASSGGSVSAAAPIGGGGGAGPATSPAYRPTTSSRPSSGPVPLGWVIIGVLVSFVAAGPLLGYARWQLLEGRI
jgi:hypothetical protein